MSRKKTDNAVAETPATVVNESSNTDMAAQIAAGLRTAADAAEFNETSKDSEFDEKSPKTVVIGVYPGTKELVKKVFETLPEGVEVVYLEDEEYNLEDLIVLVSTALSLPDLPEEFILIPCGTIPCNPADLAALELTTVYVTKDGKKQYDSRLPLVINTEDVMEILEEINTQEIDVKELSEQFAERYIKEFRPTPVEVSHNFGNYVTPVNRGNPCKNVVIEALLRKKFITAIKSGFKAIAPLIEETFK